MPWRGVSFNPKRHPDSPPPPSLALVLQLALLDLKLLSAAKTAATFETRLSHVRTRMMEVMEVAEALEAALRKAEAAAEA